MRVTKVIAALIAFGVPFGYLQATISLYIRGVYAPVHANVHASAGGLFPLLTWSQLRAAGALHLPLLELGREIMTLGIIASAAYAAGRGKREYPATFAIMYGVWQISYYFFMRVMSGWPASLLDWDLLLLVPAPWTGPVLAPMLLALALIACGASFLSREDSPVPIRFRGHDGKLLVTGCAVIALSFLSQAGNIASGLPAGGYPWPLLAAGLALGIGTLAVAARR
ncbi:MAG TPA: hypothetical protein DEH78_26970 [Solibacterales bacterium]|nr:hypothetical protein [Bryobacterales bacterium]